MPSQVSGLDQKLSKPLKVAHRGWHRNHIENTMEAFRSAYDAGCDMVEFDVQLSKDGVPFIFHDDDCLRLCGQSVSFFDLTASEICSLKMRPPAEAKLALDQYRIPSLADFLNEFGSRSFYLELKIPKAKESVATYFQNLGNITAQMVKAAGAHPCSFLGSFHAGILQHLAKTQAYPLLAGIFENYLRFQEVHSGQDQELAQGIHFYSVSWSIYEKFIKEYSSIPTNLLTENILIWDISGAKDLKRACLEGAAGLVTDDVETLLNTALEQTKNGAAKI